MNTVSNFQVGLREKEVVETMGNGSTCVSKRLKALIHESCAMIQEEARPRAAYQWVELVWIEGKITINGTTRIQSDRLHSVLRYCDQAVIFVTTLGQDTDRLIRKAASLGVYYGYVMDFVASRLAEQAAESFQQLFGKTLAPHQGMTLRYSPGYCDWPLEQQIDLFGILHDNSIGVSLNSHCLMQPEKSISGIIGIGPKDRIAQTKNACRACARIGCNHRRAK